MTDGTSTTMLIGEAPNAIFGVWASHKNVMDQSSALNLKFTSSSTPWSSCQVTAAQIAANTNGPNGLLGCDVGHQDFHRWHFRSRDAHWDRQNRVIIDSLVDRLDLLNNDDFSASRFDGNFAVREKLTLSA